MARPRWRVLGRRVWRYIWEPQGLTASFLLLLLGLPLSWWFHRDQGVGAVAQQILIALTPLVIWLSVLAVGQYLIVRQGDQRKRLVLVGGNRRVDRNGWYVLIGQTDNGITFAADLLDKADGWPLQARWELLDPYGDKHVVLIRGASMVNVGEALPRFAQVTWPLDFWGGHYARGEYSVAWIIPDDVRVEQSFRLKVKRQHPPTVSAGPSPVAS